MVWESDDMSIIHYSGAFGDFDYNDEEFAVHGSSLLYIGKELDGSKIKIPKGVKNCTNMFVNRALK